MDLPAERQPLGFQQASQGRHVAKIEELELGNDLQLMAAPEELNDEAPRVHEHVGTEIDRATGEGAGIRERVEDRQSGTLGISDRTAGGQLDHKVRGLSDRGDARGQ